MKHLRFAVATVWAGLLAGGCAPEGRGAHDARHPSDDGVALVGNAAAARVRVLPGKLDCVSEILGLVDVHEAVKGEGAALELLKRRAASLGADAVTNVEFEHGEGGPRTHLSGTAVRCNDLLRGRRFAVIEKLEVLAPMDHEEDALAELKSRAVARGANLLLEVKFEHGEGSRTRVTATAVRAYDPPAAEAAAAP